MIVSLFGTKPIRNLTYLHQFEQEIETHPFAAVSLLVTQGQIADLHCITTSLGRLEGAEPVTANLPVVGKRSVPVPIPSMYGVLPYIYHYLPIFC